jgi:hypothetical protein
MRFLCQILTSEGDSSDWGRSRGRIPLGRLLYLAHALKVLRDRDAIIPLVGHDQACAHPYTYVCTISWTGR